MNKHEILTKPKRVMIKTVKIDHDVSKKSISKILYY